MAYFLTLSGRRQLLKGIEDYRVDWDDDSLSKFQWNVKQFLREYWGRGGIVVYEELPVVGTRLRLDFYNATKRIAIECDGEQHTNYNGHFHRNRTGYFRQITRDHKKGEWCIKNKITLVRIYPEDVTDLSPEWFREKYDGLAI